MEGITSTLQNLVSALGGRDPTEPGHPYVLGDDGLGCLRDLKRWLQHYDEKRDVWDVKSALSTMNVVATDICPILESWAVTDDENEHLRRISLACGKSYRQLIKSTVQLTMKSGNSRTRHLAHGTGARCRRVQD